MINVTTVYAKQRINKSYYNKSIEIVPVIMLLVWQNTNTKNIYFTHCQQCTKTLVHQVVIKVFHFPLHKMRGYYGIAGVTGSAKMSMIIHIFKNSSVNTFFSSSLHGLGSI